MDSNIIVCEHVRSCISRTNDQGENLEVLVSHYGDKELNSPNDVVVRSDGVIFFTDPRFGRNPSRVGLERPQELDFQGVFSLSLIHISYNMLMAAVAAERQEQGEE